MADLTDAQRKFYEDALQQTKSEIQELEGLIQVVEQRGAVDGQPVDAVAATAQHLARQLHVRAHRAIRLAVRRTRFPESYRWLSASSLRTGSPTATVPSRVTRA